MISKVVQYHDIGPVKRSISHIWDHLPILKFLWLRNHHTIYITYGLLKFYGGGGGGILARGGGDEYLS